MAKKKDPIETEELEPVPDAVVEEPPPPTQTVLVETSGTVVEVLAPAFPAFGPKDREVQFGGADYVHVYDAPDGRWIYRRV